MGLNVQRGGYSQYYLFNFVGLQTVTTYCDDHFTMNTNVKSLSCTPETNIRLYVNYTSIYKTFFLQLEKHLQNILCSDYYF